jgi:uncharacterized SAM-binding protein YcdF (DUF218 family)
MMATFAPGTGNGTRRGASPAPTPLWERLRRVLSVTFAVVVLAGAGLLLGGFVWFAGHVPANEVKLDRNADGIVVLTGGSSRVADAIELLASGRGRRLLITGVHQTTNSNEIARVVPEHERFMRCCVDLDRSAINTLGNAVEARRWALDRGFHSLIVVTSSYHMPRAMAELGHQLPDVTLIPFPVVSEKLRTEPWWSNGDTAKLMLSEYVKYLLALTRMRLDPDGTQLSRYSLLHRSATRDESRS